MDVLMGRKFQGIIMGSNRFRIDLPRLIDMYVDGRLLLDEMISAASRSPTINEGYDALKRGEVTRTVIDFSL